MSNRPTSLVTGGAGFMGSHVADHLLASGHDVVVLDDLSGGFWENVPAEATFVHGSIMDHELINRLFDRHQFDYVYHLAAYAAEGLSHFIKRFNYNNNLVGSVNLINAAINHNVKCFVFTSSIAVYGAGQSPMSEDMIPDPGRFLRDFQTSGGTRTACEPRDVWSRLCRFPPPQCLRRASKHRRSVP